MLGVFHTSRLLALLSILASSRAIYAGFGSATGRRDAARARLGRRSASAVIDGDGIALASTGTLSSFQEVGAAADSAAELLLGSEVSRRARAIVADSRANATARASAEGENQGQASKPKGRGTGKPKGKGRSAKEKRKNKGRVVGAINATATNIRPDLAPKAKRRKGRKGDDKHAKDKDKGGKGGKGDSDKDKGGKGGKGGGVENIMQQLFKDTYLPHTTSDRKGELPKSFKVLRVEEMKFPERIAKYQEYKKSMKAELFALDRKQCEETNPQTPPRTMESIKDFAPDKDPCMNEVYLFHGTREEGARAIAKSGYDMKRAGSNVGGLMGPGAYLADSITKADEYSGDESLKERVVLVNKVLLGRPWTLGGSKQAKKDRKILRWATQTKVMSILKTQKKHSIFINREGKKPNPTFKEYCVFQAPAILPQYIVYYTREM